MNLVHPSHPSAVVAGHTNSYHGYDLPSSLRGIAAAGFRHVELSAVPGWTEHVPLGATSDEVHAVQELLAEYGLTCSALSGHTDLTTSAGLHSGLAAVRLCRQLQVGVLNTAMGGHADGSPATEAFLGNISRLADAAAEAAVVVGVEVHGQVTCTGRETLRMIERIDRPNVRINYDTGNCVYYGGVDPVEDVPGLAPHLAHCHLKDHRGGRGVWDFPALGDGEIDLGRVIETLRHEGFHGPWSVELEFTGEPWPSLSAVDAAMARSYRELTRIGVIDPPTGERQ